MKRGCIIALTFILAIVACDAVQFMKVPQMFRHFIQHTKIDPSLSFADFLAEHYSNIPHTDNDEAEDMKLPFKQSECGFVSIAFFFEHKTYETLQTVEYYVKPVSLYAFSCTPSEAGNAIWQPPKHA